MGYVKLNTLPARNRLALDFPRLDGGLNLLEQEIRLRGNESPELENLWWEDGALQSRPGQVWASSELPGTGFAASPEPFLGRTFLHVGSKLYAFALPSEPEDGEALPVPVEVYGGVPENRGTFFRFGDWLFYKNRGAFVKIAWDDGAQAFTVSDVAEDAFVPTILLNASPADGAGDLYQPENRLSPRKRVKYNAAASPSAVVLTGNGTSRAFSLGVTAAEQLRGVESVYLNSDFLDPALYSVSTAAGTILFNAAPPSGCTITVTVKTGVLDYHLPVQNVDAVEEVRVDALVLEEGRDYTADLAAGIVTFAEAPPVSDPPVNNTVEIVYRKDNPDARRSVMNCPYAAVCSTGSAGETAGGVQLCVVLGGCPGQPNAVFWSGNTDTGLDPSYWPMPYYNLVGDTEDAVTGFGKQYADLMVFKARSVGKLALSVVSLDGRNSISLTYTRVNDRIGCDLPWTIQIIENNLTFASSSGGVFQIRSASAAYENNIVCVSGKINGSTERPGLLHDLRTAAGSASAAGLGFLYVRQGLPVSAFDDGRRYFLAVDGHVWLWDYGVSGPDDPGWFYWTGVHPAAWFQAGEHTCHLNAAGRVTRMARVFHDYGAPFRKVYQFPARNFGTYDRLKDVETVLLSVRADTPCILRLSYQTDWEDREDLTPLTTPGWDRLSERDLAERDLSVPRYQRAFRRRPRCLHVRHFAMRLESGAAVADMSVISAQIQYRLSGRDR